MRLGALARIALLGIFVAGNATAGDFDRFGFYIGGGGSYATALWEDKLEDELGVSVHVDDGFGANARLGLRLFSAFAVEAQYEWIDDYDVGIAGIDAFDIESHVVTANLKFFLPFWRFQPYLLAGVGVANFELEDSLGLGLSESSTALAGRAALGFDVYITKNIALYAEGGVVVVDEKIDTGVPGADDVEPLFYTGAQVGAMFRF